MDVQSVASSISMDSLATTATLEEGTEIREEPTHLYFDEDGNTISRQEFEAQQTQEAMSVQEDEDEDEDEETETWIRTPFIQQKFILKHPRVLLAFLRFVDFYNELADPEEVLMLPAMSQEVVQLVQNHPAVRDVPEEFQEDVRELLYRMENHSDLSELSWS